MHEEALLRDLRNKLAELSQGLEGERIRRVTLRLGALSHLTEPALRARWPETTEGTGAEGAELVIVPGSDLSDPSALGVVLASVGLEPTRVDAKAERGPRGSGG